MSSVLFIKLKIFNIEKFYFSTLKTKLSVSCIVKNCVVKTKSVFLCIFKLPDIYLFRLKSCV